MGECSSCKVGTIIRIRGDFYNIWRQSLCPALILGLLCCASSPAAASDGTAQTPPPKLTSAQVKAAKYHKALMDLGQEFAQKIGHDLNMANLYLSGAGKIELAEHRSGTILPDNEPLLMHAVTDKGRATFTQDIYTVKRKDRLLVSLGDFCSTFDLAITVHRSKGTASGWFIRQNQTFQLDAKKRQVTIMGKTTTFDAADVDTSDGDLLVSTRLLSKWFGLSFDYDFANLNLIVNSQEPLPAVAAYERSLKQNARSFGGGTPKLPRMQVPYQMLTEPYIDVTTTSLWSHYPGTPPTRSDSWAAITNNDFAGFNLETFSSGTLDRSKKPYLQSLRMTLGKQDPDANLLGPLHATSYKMGDISPVSPPLIGGGGQEEGVVVSNEPTNNQITTQTSTELRGTAQPGWDVELYRNNVFLSIAHVDATGLYDFQNVQLVLGDNDMKMMFYGPQGEVVVKHKHILVDPSLIKRHQLYYSLSVSRNQIITWPLTTQPQPTGTGVGAINTAAEFQYGLGKIGTADFGIRRHNDAGVNRTFTEAGLSSFIGNTYYNGQIGMNAQTHAAEGVLTARRNFGQQSMLLQYTRSSPGYNTASSTTGAAIRSNTTAALSGMLPGSFAASKHLSYSASATDTHNYNGSSQLSFSPTLTARLSNLSLSAGISYNRALDMAGHLTQTETADLIGNTFILGGNLRIDNQFEILPTTRPTETDLEYDHVLGDNTDTTTILKHTDNPRFNSASFSLNWRTSKATLSPTITMDSTSHLTVGLNVHFGTAADPFTHRYNMYNAYMTSSGGVAARVFYDTNGDGIYDAGDKLMPGVVVRALQLHRNATTDTRGVAFLPDISQDTVTDIAPDASTFKDPYDITLFPGVSLRTHPGSLTKLDFPVVTGGEMDGQADHVNAKKQHTAASNLKVSLVAPDGTVEKTVYAAYDGYYAISAIRPGVYYLTAQTEDPDSTMGNFVPQMLVFKPDGTTFFGHGISLLPGYNTQFIFSSTNEAPNGIRHTRVIRPDDIAAQKVLIRLGQYQSRLGLTFTWYRFKIRSRWGSTFTLAKSLLDIVPDPKTHKMSLVVKPSHPLSLQDAARVCQFLEQDEFPCAVKVITTYRTPDLTAALSAHPG